MSALGRAAVCVTGLASRPRAGGFSEAEAGTAAQSQPEGAADDSTASLPIRQRGRDGPHRAGGYVRTASAPQMEQMGPPPPFIPPTSPAPAPCGSRDSALLPRS